MRRASNRSCRRWSSSWTSAESRSIGGHSLFWASSSRISRCSAMPESRSLRSAGSSSVRFTESLLGSAIDPIAVMGELADQRVDLLERERQLRLALEVALDEAVVREMEGERRRTRVVDAGDPVALAQREQAEDATHADLTVLAMDRLAHGSDVLSRASRPGHE